MTRYCPCQSASWSENPRSNVSMVSVVGMGEKIIDPTPRGYELKCSHGLVENVNLFELIGLVV